MRFAKKREKRGEKRKEGESVVSVERVGWLVTRKREDRKEQRGFVRIFRRLLN